MAVNHADLTTVGVFLVSPIAAGVAALSKNAGWFTVPIVVAGTLAGAGIAFLVNKSAYAILHLGCTTKNQWIAVPLLVAYILVPQMVGAAGIIGIWFATLALAHRLL